jgi:hypothetical protein
MTENHKMVSSDEWIKARKQREGARAGATS